MVGRPRHNGSVVLTLRVRIWDVEQVFNLPDEMAGCKPAPQPVTLRVTATLRTGGEDMQIGVVVGQGIATVKHPTLVGWRLLLVQPITADGRDDGEPLLAIDKLGAGPESRVLLSNDGAGAREMVGARSSPVRWMVIGICDSHVGRLS
jgi:ethanolamine utilization protein EutN